MFSQPIRFVAQTRIFARGLDDGSQALIYSMSVEIDQDLAMILPLPVPPRSSDSAVRFVDLSGYRDFFRDLDAAFPFLDANTLGLAALQQSPGRQPKLRVERVGDFEASFVPHRDDFDRLDERFRFDSNVWDKLPQYADWGFAVFKLAPRRRLFRVLRQRIHPMALVFPRRDPCSLFFPTLHVHDGLVHETAEFDHQLYCQPDAVTAATFDWQRSLTPLGESLRCDRTCGLVDPDAPAFRATLNHEQPNVDICLTPPEVDLDTLQCAGTYYRMMLDVSAAFFSADNAQTVRWKHVARTQLPQLAAGLATGLDALTQENARRWHLAEYQESVSEYSMSWVGRPGGTDNYRLVGPSTGFPGAANYVPPKGGGRVVFSLRDDPRVQMQRVALCFDEVPSPQRMTEIQQALDTLLAAVPLDFERCEAAADELAGQV